MVITLNNLIAKDYDKETTNYFKENFGTAAEFGDLCKDTKLDKYFIHTIFYDFITTEEDKLAYLERMDIKDSSSYYRSSNLKNSVFIVESDKVNFSEKIFYSKNVTNSKKVFSSYDISDSKDISFSNNVRDSKNVLSSKEIIESDNIVSSNNITKSSSIYRSEAITGSYMIQRSHHLNSCIFTSRCSNSNGLLFCYDIDNTNLMLFNKPIKFSVYSKIFREFSERFRELFTYIMMPMEERYNASLSQCEIYNIKKHYIDLPKEFWEWVKTLPNYNGQIMYNITFLNSFLRTKEN